MYVNINIEDMVQAVGTMIEYKGDREVGMDFLQDLYLITEDILTDADLGIQNVAELLSDPRALAMKIVDNSEILKMVVTIPEVRHLIQVGKLSVHTLERRQVYPSLPDRLDMKQSYNREKVGYTEVEIVNHANNHSIQINVQQVAGDALDVAQAGVIENAILQHRKSLGL